MKEAKKTIESPIYPCVKIYCNKLNAMTRIFMHRDFIDRERH